MTIEEMERLYAEASKGPWIYSICHWGAGDVMAPGYGKSTATCSLPELGEISPDHTYVSVTGDQTLPADGNLIVAMHRNLPALLAVVKAAKARMEFANNFTCVAEESVVDRPRSPQWDRLEDLDNALRASLLPFAERQG